MSLAPFNADPSLQPYIQGPWQSMQLSADLLGDCTCNMDALRSSPVSPIGVAPTSLPRLRGLSPARPAPGIAPLDEWRWNFTANPASGFPPIAFPI